MIVLPPDASELDKANYELCKKMLVFMHKKKLSQRELAGVLGVPETRVSEIVHYRIHKFSFDKLFLYAEKIDPKVTLRVA